MVSLRVSPIHGNGQSHGRTLFISSRAAGNRIKNIFCWTAEIYGGDCNLAHWLRVVMTTKDSKMKTSVLLFATFAFVVTNGNAAEKQIEPDIVVLPTYVVTVPRYLPFEKEIKANLAEAAHRARTTLAITAELPSLKTEGVSHELVLNTSPLKSKQGGKS